jgi:hypothetical protein
MPVMGVSRFTSFFRAAAGLDVDKNDLKRYNDFLNDKIYDMFIIAEGNAKANDRDVIFFRDLPITKGLQESMHQFEKLDQGIEVEPLLEELAARPPLDLVVLDEVEQRLPAVAGGLSLALARAFTITTPDVKNPGTREWDTVLRLFELLL